MSSKTIAIIVLAVSVVVLIAVLFSRAKPVQDNSTAITIMQRELDSLKTQNKRMQEADRLLYEGYEKRKRVDSILLDNAIKNKNEAVNKIHDFNSDSLSRYFEGL